jgi:hypothetical protein
MVWVGIDPGLCARTLRDNSATAEVTKHDRHNILPPEFQSEEIGKEFDRGLSRQRPRNSSHLALTTTTVIEIAHCVISKGAIFRRRSLPFPAETFVDQSVTELTASAWAIRSYR